MKFIALSLALLLSTSFMAFADDDGYDDDDYRQWSEEYDDDEYDDYDDDGGHWSDNQRKELSHACKRARKTIRRALANLDDFYSGDELIVRRKILRYFLYKVHYASDRECRYIRHKVIKTTSGASHYSS